MSDFSETEIRLKQASQVEVSTGNSDCRTSNGSQNSERKKTERGGTNSA